MDLPNPSTFTCAYCGGTFDQDPQQTETHRAIERAEIFGEPPQPDDIMVCDPCFREVIANAIQELARIEQVINLSQEDHPQPIERGDRDLHDWLAQILQAAILRADNAERALEKCEKHLAAANLGWA